MSIADREPRSGKRGVDFDIRWPGTTFPGIFRCTWTLRDAAGSVVGEHRDVLVDVRPVATGTMWVETSGEPVSAEFACDPDRLDSGDPYEYAISNIRVDMLSTAEVPEGGQATPSAKVTFSARWRGDGYPGVVYCTLAVIGGSGSTVASTDLVFQGGDDSTSSQSIETTVVDDRLSSPSESVAIDCQPFSDQR
jgi:hypothetical protein